MMLKLTGANTQRDVRTEYYDAVDLMKFICSLMVVMIHCKPLLPYSDFWNTFTAEGVCRIAVPFFFTISGVFLYRKLIQHQNECGNSERFKICLQYSMKNAKLYLSWSVVYIALHAVLQWPVDWAFAVDQFRLLIFDASHYHFWYLLALIYAGPWVSKLFFAGRKTLVGIIAAGWMMQSFRFVYRWLPGGEHHPLDNTVH